MSTPVYKSLTDTAYDYRFLQSVGPFDMEPNDTINIVWACGINNGIDSVRLESAWAKSIYDNEYIVTAPNQISNPTDKKFAKEYALNQNYPNPFNPSTTIEFSIPKTEYVTLKIYNILGKEVTTLVSDKLTPGIHKYTWDATDFASGLYYYRIETSDPSTSSGQLFVKTRKLLLIK